MSGGDGSGTTVDVTVVLGISGAGTAVLVCGRVLGGAVGRVVGRTGAGGGATALRGVTISLVALMGATDLCGWEIRAIVAPRTTSGTPISRVVSSANRRLRPVVTSGSRRDPGPGASRPERECGFEMLKSVSAQVNRILSRVRRRSQAGAGTRIGAAPSRAAGLTRRRRSWSQRAHDSMWRATRLRTSTVNCPSQSARMTASCGHNFGLARTRRDTSNAPRLRSMVSRSRCRLCPGRRTASRAVAVLSAGPDDLANLRCFDLGFGVTQRRQFRYLGAATRDGWRTTTTTRRAAAPGAAATTRGASAA